METEKENEQKTDIAVANESTTETKVETRLEDLPRIEDLLKSENEIAPKKELKGVTQVESNAEIDNKTFSMKKDEKKSLAKKRVKILTSVYISVVSLLLILTGVNVVTLALLSKDINSNTTTIKSEQQTVSILQEQAPETANPTESFTISLNEPRDYGDDRQELTFFDKLSILFRSIFG